jgi:hypothetical protein
MGLRLHTAFLFLQRWQTLLRRWFEFWRWRLCNYSLWLLAAIMRRLKPYLRWRHATTRGFFPHRWFFLQVFLHSLLVCLVHDRWRQRGFVEEVLLFRLCQHFTAEVQLEFPSRRTLCAQVHFRLEWDASLGHFVRLVSDRSSWFERHKLWLTEKLHLFLFRRTEQQSRCWQQWQLGRQVYRRLFLVDCLNLIDLILNFTLSAITSITAKKDLQSRFSHLSVQVWSEVHCCSWIVVKSEWSLFVS